MHAVPLVTAQSLRGYLNIFINPHDSQQAFPNTLEITGKPTSEENPSNLVKVVTPGSMTPGLCPGFPSWSVSAYDIRAPLQR